MQQSIVIAKGKRIAILHSDEPLIGSVQDALDLIMRVGYEDDCDRVVLDKEAICEEFFDLSTGLAGEVLQKFATYSKKVAIIGDFSRYKSKAFHDLIRECNRGRDAFFASSEEEAVKRLSAV